MQFIFYEAGRVRVGRTHLVAVREKHTFKLPAATYLGIK